MQAILNVAFPIFGVILAGYLAGRWRILGGEATTALNAFVSYFALPVLFFGTLARTPVAAVLDPALMLGFGAAVVATFAVGMASTRLVSRGPAKAGSRAMSLQGIAASWGNVGYMGVPLCLAAFGEAGLPPAMLAVIVTSDRLHGVRRHADRARGRGRPRAAEDLPAGRLQRGAQSRCRCRSRSASWFRRVGLPLPTPVEKWLDLMGAAAAPCALFAIGLFLSDKSIKQRARRSGPRHPDQAPAAAAAGGAASCRSSSTSDRWRARSRS